MEKPIKAKRLICPRCDRPTPTACICSCLPIIQIELKNCNVFVLQHPHETRMQNRSLPFVELCLDTKHVQVLIARKLTEKDDFYRVLDKLETPLWLVYPGADAISLSQAIMNLRGNQNKTPSETFPSDSNETLQSPSTPVSLLFIDATWKFAREMLKASIFPPHVQRVQLDELDLKHVRPRRFDIRTPPSDQHLSTAECIGLVLRKVEDDDDIYKVIMRPLDFMVQQWHAFAEQSQRRKEEARARNRRVC
ncbi:hypothetical protein MPSEU_000618100 [Mayamaea pseudoterrestris]|nr:hypothetical protein MPSEU_000618100 [Mayamaea pseudoterrestris]